MSNINVPMVILEMHEYRKKILHTKTTTDTTNSNTTYEQSDSLSNILESLKLLDISSDLDIQDRTRKVFLWIVEHLGYDEFRKLAISFKSMASLSQQEYRYAKGELAEVFFYVTAREFFRKNSCDQWKPYHHLFVPYLSKNDPTQGTEVDLVIASPYTIIMVESKSWNGEKVLTDKCTLVRTCDGKEINKHDVFSQSAHHSRALMEHIENYALSTKGIIKNIFFNFSLGSIEDKRVLTNQKLMPMIDENNIISFLSALVKLNKMNWRADALMKIEEFSSLGYNRDAHVNRLTGGENNGFN